MVAGMRSYLAATGLNVAAEIDCGALIISSSNDHLVAGAFDADRMLTRLEDTLVQALRDSYAGLWASGDMA